MFKIIPTVRGGTTNSPRIFERYATVDEARESSKQLIHESGRVTRVMIVADEETPRFMEWIERS
ncbi:MAG: hypothetical protein CL489_05545 [Acidobacteria bacterium]|nr:hypothetical protein [Acidobacteriota bacterium]MBF83924.1 hypothetical protein [Acidobacteriota bacterium]MCH2278684.1 hypothetical protein [Vicinamibacterales bacterium]MEC7768194.1 hypothetical protein [Acidobacteriota bacterium]|tara:strand:- start:23 stop:214 length:192 start_codon:yes stop_codon:yes gene_type:complete